MWTPELLETVRRLATAEKLDARVIAARIGKTRNAVIGKCHRHNISLPGRGAPYVVKKITDPELTVRAPSADGEKALPRAPRSNRDAIASAVYELRDDQCRWMVSESSFCGGVGRPFCPVHRAIAYQPRKPRV